MDGALEQSLLTIAIGPMLAAILAPVLVRAVGHFAGWLLAIVPLAIVLFLAQLVGAVSENGAIHTSLPWAPSLGLDLSFTLDGLSLLFALAISSVGTLIVIYAGAYLADHSQQGRFLMFLMLFMGAMLGLVLADNLIALVVFWELTSITSFLLIGFDHRRQAARRAGIQALIITNIGGLALLLAAVVVFAETGVWNISAMGEGLQAHPVYPLILVLVCLAAFTKSAQLPFHFWLPNAMEAPTPVSAFLHSATMVQAGVYLLMRMTPTLGGTPAWTVVLCGFGAATLLWGAVGAMRETDLKRILAATTIASLGLTVLLIGWGSEAALAGAALYFTAHALYKAGLFMVAGTIDHGTGTRDIGLLGGLMRKMPISFLATLLGSLAMIAVPPTLAYLAKEELYLSMLSGEPGAIALLVVLVLGNALLGAIGLLVLVRPFFGPLGQTPLPPHEGTPGLILGSLLLGIVGLVGGVFTDGVAHFLLSPLLSALTGHGIEAHLTLVPDFTSPALWASILTWILAGLLFWQIDRLRLLLRRIADGISWTFDDCFDAILFGLIRFAGALTRSLQHGRLELYLVVLFAGLALALVMPLVLLDALPGVQAFEMPTLGEACALGLALLGLVAVLVARTRLVLILNLGIQGLAVALIFLLFGAPDLAFTQLMVEVLSVVILTLVMTRLKLDQSDPRPFEDFLRDGTLALACGTGFTLLLWAVLAHPLDMRLTEFFAATSVEIAHGRNIVNVILVDYRGLDTLGEIAVVLTAGASILLLLRRQERKAAIPSDKPITPSRARKPRGKKAVAP